MFDVSAVIARSGESVEDEEAISCETGKPASVHTDRPRACNGPVNDLSIVAGRRDPEQTMIDIKKGT
jgi:hypothetical protein